MPINKQAGFTLLEVMITMFIVSIGLLGTAKMLITVVQQNKGSELRIDASATVHTLLNAASSSITTVSDCKSLSANPTSRTYLGNGYLETVSCQELGSGKERYRVSAKLERYAGVDSAGVKTTKILAESSTIITTASAKN